MKKLIAAVSPFIIALAVAGGFALPAEAAPKPAVTMYYNIVTDSAGARAVYSIQNMTGEPIQAAIQYTSEDGRTNQTAVVTIAPNSAQPVVDTTVVTGNGIVLTAELKLYDATGVKVIDRVRINESR